MTLPASRIETKSGPRFGRRGPIAFGRGLRRASCYAALCVGMMMIVCSSGHTQAAQPAAVMPSDQALTVMILSTLLAYNDGNKTGNYTVLRDLASPEFRDSNSAARLSDVFREVRENEVDIAPIVLFPPKLLRAPEIDKDGDLILEGFFDTTPERVSFLLVFRAAQGKWRLFAIRVTTGVAQNQDTTVPAVSPPPAPKPAKTGKR